MELSRHCALCENEITSLKKGVTCRLTGEKPDFIEKCPDIVLDEKFQEKLGNTNLELERTRKVKNNVYLTFYILIIIGFLLIIGNKMYAELTYSTTYYWLFRVSAIAAGITVLMGAYNKLNRFRNKLKIAEFEKNKIDSVLKEYGISYKTNFDFKEKIHGNQNIEITIEYKNWTKKRTTTTWVINC